MGWYIAHVLFLFLIPMDEQQYENVKEAVLAHIQSLFDEMEEEMATSHQEKYALLEDALENATDIDELRVAFEQWYADHAEAVSFEHDADELWAHATAVAAE